MKTKSELARWINERPAFAKLYQTHPHIHTAAQLASDADWTVERFLEYCVEILAESNALMADELFKQKSLTAVQPRTFPLEAAKT